MKNDRFISCQKFTDGFCRNGRNYSLDKIQFFPEIDFVNLEKSFKDLILFFNRVPNT